MDPSLIGLAAAAATLVLVAGSGGTGDPRTWSRARGRALHGRTQARPPIPAALHRALDAAQVADPVAWTSRWAISVLVLGLVAIVVAPLRLVAPVALLAPGGWLVVNRDRTSRARRRQLPEALEAVSAGLRAGMSLTSAISAAGELGAPLGPELTRLAQVAHGHRLRDALEGWRGDHPDPDTNLAAAALRVADQVGGPNARALDQAAASLRERLGTEAELRALATQGRASALVLTVAPIGFAVMMSSIDPAAGRFLTGTPLGWACIVVGCTLDGLGAWWMSRLVRSAR